jgi:uncharacterized protein YbjT (DUF2867 family)
MKVFLTGGTGFVGTAALEQLLQAGHTVRCLARSGSERKLHFPPEKRSQIEIALGDITQPELLKSLIAGCDAVVHLVGIIREIPRAGVTFEKIHYEGTRNVVDAAQSARHDLRSAGTKRFVHVSALGTRPNARSRYHQTKYRAEEYLKASGLCYTIFRPSIMFGARDKFVNLLRRFIFPCAPVFIPGNGKSRLQPIAVEDVALALTRALTSASSADRLERSENQIYEVGGPEQFTFDELIDAIAEVKGVRCYVKVHTPLGLLKPAVRLLERFLFFPLSSDQLVMLTEDNVCDASAFVRDFEIALTPFREGIARYIR